MEYIQVLTKYCEYNFKYLYVGTNSRTNAK